MTMNYIDQLLAGIEGDDRAESDVPIRSAKQKEHMAAEDAMWAANAEEEPKPLPRVPIQESQREVAEIGEKILVIKEGPRSWCLGMAVRLEGEERLWLASIGQDALFAFRTYESRDEARRSRDWVALRIRNNPATVLYAGICTDNKREVIPFKPGEFRVEFKSPAGLQTFGRKEEK